MQRQQQLEWQEARKHERQEDERIFDEMWEQERLKKVQRAVDDMERAHKMNMALRTQLKAQKDAYDQVKERERQMRAEEDRLYKEQVRGHRRVAGGEMRRADAAGRQWRRPPPPHTPSQCIAERRIMCVGTCLPLSPALHRECRVPRGVCPGSEVGQSTGRALHPVVAGVVFPRAVKRRKLRVILRDALRRVILRRLNRPIQPF